MLKIGKELEAKHRSISVEISDYLAVDGVSDAQPSATEETAQAAQA
ncbi:hypothetical protein [Alicyclobacillus acidocaldarius]|uniref:Uncharacterized protein n=1 Tax=Alicyclobacillus acidocaldarius (strain Tc-4-1) TaxID=1048834 RepID=F8IDE6_ALIAT|nr:hypothetical protein [Alicyclobacillus acidocaldarius]AEJ43799.1 hypothetical protein TC41_1883 [Alicyclobacillus acidocaldarius subsp. acidocaldarius Tc-4-1]